MLWVDHEVEITAKVNVIIVTVGIYYSRITMIIKCVK